MSDTSKLKECPKCGGPIPAEAPQGLCPKCLMAQASIPTETGEASSLRPAPPPLADVAAAFPHLEILELIGQGGMGFVYKARQPKLERFVALKILPHTSTTDPRFAERFTREGRLLARLNHPNIVTIHDFGQADGFFYLLMEYVDGVNLRQAMRAGRFTPEQALAVVPKICDALQFAHSEGVLHRDIKPENILLDPKGRVKIADFGIAKLIGEAQSDMHLTASGGALGTPHYMAPEQIEKPASVDHRADIYSLGVVFYEMLTGELPLGKFQPPSQKVQVDVRLDDVVLHALEKEPARRYQQVSEVRTAVDTITASPGSTAPPPSPPVLASRRIFGPAVKAGLAVFVLTFLLLALFASNFARDDVAGAIVVGILAGLVLGGITALFTGLISAWRSPATASGAARGADPFWRRFAIAVTSFVVALILLPMAVIFFAMLVPAVMKHRAQREEAIQAEMAAEEARAMISQHEGTVLGTVIDSESGRPVPGAHILDRLFRQHLTGEVLQETTSDSAGRFKLHMRVTEPHLLTLFAAGYATNGVGVIPEMFTNKIQQRMEIRVHPIQSRDADFGRQLRSILNTNGLPVPEFFLDAQKYSPFDAEPGQLDWGFKAFVPPDSLATLLFVVWSNGVPTVDPGFSTYFKVGQAGGIDIPFCSVSCYREAESRRFASLNASQQAEYLAGWRYPESAGSSNAVHWNVNLGANATAGALKLMPPYHRVGTTLPQTVESGRQMRFPLIEFDPPPNGQSNGWSGVDLRIFLEPLRVPPIRMLPNEIDMTNYVAARGLPGTVEEEIKRIRETPLGSGAQAHNGPASTQAEEVAQVVAQLEEALTKYTDNHPTVIALRARLKQLMEQNP